MKMRNVSPTLFLICVVTLTSAFNLPNKSPDTSSRQLGSSSSMAAKPVKRTTLNFADRVAYQQAIEKVYWRHRVWPNENPDPKPSLEGVMPWAQVEKKVTDYLRISAALQDYWKEPLSAEQLQAEMERMAQHTRQPEVLRELFDALGNNPFVIAECLARPTLSQRLVTGLYAHDQRFHGELRRRAEADLRAHHTVGQMKQTSGTYSEIKLIRSDNSQDRENGAGERTVTLNTQEWDENVQKLATMFDDGKNSSLQCELGHHGVGAQTAQIKTGVVSPLQEDERRYYATAVVRKSQDRMTLATVEWRKEPLESWETTAEIQTPDVMVAASPNYTLPAISDAASGCTNDTWTATLNSPSGRHGHTAVWTGSEMIIWGGDDGGGRGLNTGGRYNPSTDTWTDTSLTNAPEGVTLHTAVWTGTEMIVWGGGTFGGTNTGGRYNPSTNSWTATSTTNAPSARVNHIAVWTGTQMIIWGGDGTSGITNTGGRYNPSTNSWTATSTTNAPSARVNHIAVWTGTQMIIWGGYDNNILPLNTGGRYNPATNSWTATSITNAPTARIQPAAVWTGTLMIIWGGDDPSGGTYNPSTNSWTATSTVNAPSARHGVAWVWTGSEMIVWGGSDGSNFFNTGGRYNPGTNTWTATSTTNAPDERAYPTGVWTGTEMIVWGGFNTVTLSSGGRYDPSTDTWAATKDSPLGRQQHTVVWTGSEMIIWGGTADITGDTNTGGRYNPSTDSWTDTSITNAPSARFEHTAVWTGTQMLIWGGSSGDSTGGRYNPSTNTWTATSTVNAPTPRANHTAVWTGTQMIVWGGAIGCSNLYGCFVNSGGRYNPSTNSWTATSTTNAPSARDNHTAVWTGTEMIVWGGVFVDSNNTFFFFNSGGRYNPSTNTWTATSLTSAPSARLNHTAVWTGSEMIIWGGTFAPDGVNFSYFNSGGRYSPGTNSWTTTSTTNAPSARDEQSAVWTGTQMIIWGGYDGGNDGLNTGGRYDPSTNSWTATSITNAPEGRTFHTAVWTGSQMIIWGGGTPFGFYLNSGGRYCAQASSTGPLVTTKPATNVAAFSTTLNGTVNPNGLTTSVLFQYGKTTNYGSTTTAQSKTGSTSRNVSANISGLSANTIYHFRIVGTNSAGTSDGSDKTFTTLSATGVPVVTTKPATNVTTSSATLNGLVDPHGLTTTVDFQYGTTTNYGSTTTPQSETGDTYRNVSANVTGLKASTIYHFRIVGTNSAGTKDGSDKTFTTP